MHGRVGGIGADERRAMIVARVSLATLGALSGRRISLAEGKPLPRTFSSRGGDVQSSMDAVSFLKALLRLLPAFYGPDENLISFDRVAAL